MNNVPTGDWLAAIRGTLTRHRGGDLVVSPDLDGLCSAAIAHHYFGMRTIGLYDLQRVLLFDGVPATRAWSALWLDHDISSLPIDSLGHHLLHHSPEDALRRRSASSFNPNVWVGQAWRQSFRATNLKPGGRDKYPFGTTHMLMPAVDMPVPDIGTEPFHLLAHCDSAWANAVDYGVNATWWTQNFFSGHTFFEILTTGLPAQVSADAHTRVVERLSESGFARGRSGATSVRDPVAPEWQALRGGQRLGALRRGELDVAQFSVALGAIEELLGLLPQPKPTKCRAAFAGQYISVAPSNIVSGQFDAFLDEHDVFSYAITSNRQISCTMPLRPIRPIGEV